jgi:hypothetical protein
MTDFKEYADQVLEEYNLCVKARPKHNAVGIQILKDSVGKWASHLATQRSWGTETEIAEACHQLAPRLQELKEQVIFEVLKNGTV